MPVVGVVGLNLLRHFDFLPRGEHVRSGGRSEAAGGERMCPGIELRRFGVLRVKCELAQRDGIALYVFGLSPTDRRTRRLPASASDALGRDAEREVVELGDAQARRQLAVLDSPNTVSSPQKKMS